MRISEMTAGILAGGKHTRMVRDKLLLSYKGKSFLEKIYEECEGFDQVLVSVADAEKYRQFDYCFVEDTLEGFGPLEGICQLLKRANREYIFVLAADMPGITNAFLRSMAERLTDEDCIVLKTEDGIHPLCAIYARRALPLLEKMRQEGERRPRMLFEQCRTVYVTAEELGYTDAIVQNINTPEEYERLEAKDEIN